ncbi:small multidrug efflux protein [Arthrobacter gengyunqii]|uniref:Small multidrug efflux protein n=1 Tax=Arthrobacter gengyunqii TaxID=2886940 RepID=A0A9X1M5Q6_9MICC|nr:small multidrug efflux protein [Arthrobacter gengyunqii]MCC3271072.1 small multidrug efflux protein [Arthrobacter gengyunqii]UOY96758.1 small multidrug efflux protein [Arthrobacter gengyunqii]
MNPIESLVSNLQELAAQVPEIIQPLVVALAGAVPFVEGEGGAIIGVVGGMHVVIAAIAAAAGNFLSVLVVVLLGSRARHAVVERRAVHAVAAGAAAGGGSVETLPTVSLKPESKGQQRFKRWLVRFGVPGASILGPLAIPTQFTSAMLVAAGTPRGWVLLWQGVAIILWTTVAAVSVWAALTFIVLS